MKKSLILILFTFICFITFTTNVFAASCWRCYCKTLTSATEYNVFQWSEAQPDLPNRLCLVGKKCEATSINESTCNQYTQDGELSHDKALKKIQDYENSKANESDLKCWRCYITKQSENENSYHVSVNKPNLGNHYTCIEEPGVSLETCENWEEQGVMNRDEADDLEDDYYHGSGDAGSLPNVGFGEEMSCSELLGPSLTKLVSILLDAFKIAAMIICTVQMMMALIPPITNKDSDALNKAIKKCVTLAIIFVCALLIDTFIVVIGRLFGFDLSCFR